MEQARKHCHRGARFLLFVALALCSRPLPAADNATLVPGADLPQLDATTLSGEAASLPRDAAGHPALLVISFTKAASKVTRPWLEGCWSAAAEGSRAPGMECYDLRMLEEVPRAFRGMAERGMRHGLPAELQRQTLLVYAGNDAWRERVGEADDKTAYVIGLRRDGRVGGMTQGAYTETEMQKMLDGLETEPAKPDSGNR